MIDLSEVTTMTPEKIGRDLLREQREVLKLYYESQQQCAQAAEANESLHASETAEIERKASEHRNDINKLVTSIKSSFNDSQNRLRAVNLGNLLIGSQVDPVENYPDPDKVLAGHALRARQYFEQIRDFADQLAQIRRIRGILITVGGFVSLGIMVMMFVGVVILAQQFSLSMHYKAAQGAIQSGQWETAYQELTSIQKVNKNYKDVPQLLNKVLPGYLQVLSKSGRCDEIKPEDLNASTAGYYTQCGLLKTQTYMIDQQWAQAWDTILTLDQNDPNVILTKLNVIAAGRQPQTNDYWQNMKLNGAEQNIGNGTPNTHMWLDDVEPLSGGRVFLDLAISIDDGWDGARVLQPDRVYLVVNGAEISYSESGGFFGTDMYIPELSLSGAHARQLGHLTFNNVVQNLPVDGCFTFHYGNLYTIENICIWTRR